MDIIDICALVTASVGLFTFVLDWMWKPKLDLPYPKRLPVIGNLVAFLKNPPATLSSWAKLYGDIYCVQLLNKTVVIVNGYEAAYEVLVKKGKEFAGRTHTFRSDMVSGNGSDIIYLSINPRWKKLRMFIHQNVKQRGEGLERVEDIVQQMAHQLIESIKQESLQGVIDPYEHIYFAGASSMTVLISGNRFTSDDPMFRKIVEVERLLKENMSLANGGELDVMPWLRHLGNKTYKSLRDLVKVQSDIYQTFRNMYMEGTLSQDGLIFSLMHEMNKKRSEISHILNDEIIQVVIYDIILAGVATSSASLYTFLMVMASNPKVQQTFFEEIVRCKRESKIQMSLDDRANMPYARALLLELMRYASVAPMTLDHTSMEDTDILGHRIPKGTEVYVNLLGLHHSDKYWDEPWSFRPERFLDEDGQVVPSDHINRKRLMPFGAGPRVCIGQSFALSRLFVLTTSLVRAFEIRPVSDKEIQVDPRKFKMGLFLNAPRSKLVFIERCLN